MTEELLKQADEIVKSFKDSAYKSIIVKDRGIGIESSAKLFAAKTPIREGELATQLFEATIIIKALADELRGNQREKEYIYKQVERGLFDKHTTPEIALSNIAYWP